MQTFNLYIREGFKLFPCNLDKTPRVSSWRDPASHIGVDTADKIASHGGFIGAWLPKNYVVIDVDRNHGEGKADGMPIYQDLCAQLGIPEPQTLTVKTGSGGLHLYFKLPEGTDYRTLSQKSIADSVDVRTHLGYVIAAGTNGYTVAVDRPAATIPEELLVLIQTRNKDRAKEHVPEKELPVELLVKLLNKIEAEHFANNDDWQEFVISCIAAAGNSEDVLNAIEDWSRTDPSFKEDIHIRKRLQTFEPSGGITVGTFLHILKKEGVSKYLIDKVRMHVGAQFSFSEAFSQAFDPPFTVDYDKVDEYNELAAAYYYQKNQVSAVELFTHLVNGNLYYVEGDRAFYYFNGNRWVEESGIVKLIFSVLTAAMQRFYSDHSKPNDGDADDYITSCINYTASYATLGRFENAVKQHPTTHLKSVDWDSSSLAATLTLTDCVMDFSGKKIVFRKGTHSEYRKRYIDLCESDFKEVELPQKFREFLKDVFPNEQTRRTATYALSTMLSGTGKFRKFQLWNGAGSNGKSTLMEMMKDIIGDRAISYKPEILLNKVLTHSLTPELAVFRGALVAFSSETEEQKRISQGAVKSLTGNETVVANPKYKDVVEFKTTFQLVLATNYLPTFSAHDSAFISRILVLPFHTCFYKSEEQKERAARAGSRYFIEARDPEKIMAEVRQERPSVLYYLASRYQELDSEIPESEETLATKKHYVDDNNDIFQFLTDFCEYSDVEDWFTPTKDLVNFYNEENNTRYSSKYVVMRLKEVFPKAETTAKKLHGKVTRGIPGIRIKYGAYDEGYMGNYTQEEIKQSNMEEEGF